MVGWIGCGKANPWPSRLAPQIARSSTGRPYARLQWKDSLLCFYRPPVYHTALCETVGSKMGRGQWSSALSLRVGVSRILVCLFGPGQHRASSLRKWPVQVRTTQLFLSSPGLMHRIQARSPGADVPPVEMASSCLVFRPALHHSRPRRVQPWQSNHRTTGTPEKSACFVFSSFFNERLLSKCAFLKQLFAIHVGSHGKHILLGETSYSFLACVD